MSDTFELTNKHRNLLISLTKGMTVYLGKDKRTSSHWEKLQQAGYVNFENDHVHITEKGRAVCT